MDYQEVGRGGNNWIYLARDGDIWRALLTAVILTFVFRKMGEFVEYRGTVIVSGRTLLHVVI
jgi:hypothetical protein